MNRLCKMIPVLALLAAGYTCAAQQHPAQPRILVQDTAKPSTPAIPIFYSRKPYHKFSTQVNFLAGSALAHHGDRPLLSLGALVKGVYNTTGNTYVCGGASISYLHSVSRTLPDVQQTGDVHKATLVSLPAGVGFTMGDDRASFLCGIDALPSLYINTANNPDARKFAMGFGPEFGFMFKIGRHSQKGAQLGMIGTLQFFQPPNKSDGSGIQYSMVGVGTVLRWN